MTVLLIGGPSVVGKTTVVRQLAARLNSSFVLVDDLRLALARSRVAVPDVDAVATFDAPGGLVDLDERMTPAIEELSHEAESALGLVTSLC